MRHLRVLCAIADAGSLHGAARALGTSQPALTTQLRRIERDVGRAPLLARADRLCAHGAGPGRGRPGPAAARRADRPRHRDPGRGRPRGRRRRLRIGSTASRAIPGWLRRLRERLPGTETELQVAVSATALLRQVAAGELDVAFVHEVEGCPLRVPPGLTIRVRWWSASRSSCAWPPTTPRPATRSWTWPTSPPTSGWSTPAWTASGRACAASCDAAGLNPRVLHGDYLTAAGLVATGEVVTLCQPTSRPRPDLAIRPLRDDPLGVRLLVAVRGGAYGGELAGVGADLEAAYWEAAAARAPRTGRGWRSGAGSGSGPVVAARSPGVSAARGPRVRPAWSLALLL